MKYVQINTVPSGSTGAVMFCEQAKRRAAGDECWVMWGRGRPAENDHEFNFGSNLGTYVDAALTRVDDRAGFHSKAATRRLIGRLNQLDPDVVHLHNLHGYYLDIEMLFQWLCEHRCDVKWTLHDCWPFTGHCTHFTYVGCDRWKSQCRQCPQKGIYPKSLVADSSARNFEDKRRIFTSLPTDKLTIIVPSQWLADIVKESYLSNYPRVVERNTVDKRVFKPTDSTFRQERGLQGKFIVLGVAYPFTERKGLQVFYELSHILGHDFAVVLVGLTKTQIKHAPIGVVGIERIDSKERLAQIYSAADVYLQPSIEETYGLTVSEAQACGTRTIVMRGSACEEIARLSDIAYDVSDGISCSVSIIRALEASKRGSGKLRGLA